MNNIPAEHYGRQGYIVKPTKQFESEDDYVSALSDYCAKKGYVFIPEEAKTDVFAFLADELKKSLNASGAARVDVIGLDREDNDRIDVMWCEKMATALVITYCGSGLRGHPQRDYTDKAASFVLEFFGSFVFSRITDESFFHIGK